MRWLISAIFGLVVLVVLAVATLFLLPADRIAALAADRIAAATGRQVEIAGDVRPTLFPSLGVRAEQFTIGNPDWVDAGPMISAEALAVSVPWRTVFADGIEVEEVTLIGPQITLVRAADGRTSWSFESGDAAVATDIIQPPPADAPSDAAPTDSGGGGTLDLALDRATVQDGQVTYLDLGQDLRIDVTDVTADLTLPNSGVARLTLDAAVNGTQASVTAEVDGITQVMAGEVRPLIAALSWQGGEAGFDGRVSMAPAAEGQFTLDTTDLGPLMALAGQAAPDLPQGLGRDRIVAGGQITLTEEGTLHLRNGAVTLDRNALAIDLDVTPGSERPNLRGTITADALSLPSSSGGGGGGGGGAGGGGGGTDGWSTAPIDVSPLFAANAEIGLRLGSLTASDTTIAPLNARLTNSDGRAVIDIENAGLYGGTLAGQVVVNGRGGLSARTDLILAGVQLQPLLSATAGYDRLEGSGSISIQLLGVGNSMAALMSSLDGQGDLAFGSGAIIGLDIAGMIRNFDTSFQGPGQRTVYDSVTASFTVTEGRLRNDDLELVAPWGGVTGSGRVNIGRQTLNYRVIPGVLRDDDGATEINVPVLISGPWASPSFQPDLAYLAEQDLSNQADQLGDAAREAVEDALGTDLPDDAGIEEIGPALDDALREEAESALERLFGGN